jgi:hypothetical protein
LLSDVLRNLAELLFKAIMRLGLTIFSQSNTIKVAKRLRPIAVHKPLHDAAKMRFGHWKTFCPKKSLPEILRIPNSLWLRKRPTSGMMMKGSRRLAFSKPNPVFRHLCRSAKEVGCVHFPSTIAPAEY